MMSVSSFSAQVDRDHETRQSHNDGSGEGQMSEEQKLPVTIAQPSFPEGGLKAWLVVSGCWCTSFVSFGTVNSFG